MFAKTIFKRFSKRNAKLIGALLISFFFFSCTLSSEEIEYKKGVQAVQDSNHEKAFQHFKNVVDRYVKSPHAIASAKEAARIAHYELKKFPEAIGYYKHVILYSTVAEERLDAQKKIADLHFTQTLDYAQAIAEYNRLLDLPHSPAEASMYRLAVARSYFYLNNFFQSLIEIDRILEKARPEEQDLVFDALLLKANILLTTKKLDDAILVLQKLIKDHPERAKKETIGLILAICYEEQKNFAKAIEVLNSIKDDYPRKAFLENKIRALKERQSYLPGAKGFRK